MTQSSSLLSWLNQPALDFGLYRIVHARSKEIRAFMQTERVTEIDTAAAGQAPRRRTAVARQQPAEG